MKWVRLYVTIAGALLLVPACAKTSTVESFVDTGKPVSDSTGEDGRIVIGVEDIQLPDVPSDTGLDWGIDRTSEDLLDLFFELPDHADVVELLDVTEVTEIVDVPETTEVAGEVDTGSCTPACGGKVCGTDGCDGVCGYCAYGEICSPEGKCVTDVCPKQCEAEVEGQTVAKECGSDGCGGYCGFCVTEGDFCGNDGFCYGGSCVPKCDGKACGPDGCGSTCGFCQTLEMCDENGGCVPHPCGDVTYKGKCEDKYLLKECVDLAIKVTMCKSEPGKMCGWNESIGTYSCVEETACVPECSFDDGSPKECGPDGCWGACGICPAGWGCGGGMCQPAQGGECAWIDATVKSCVDHVKWFCSAGKLYNYDCMAQEQKTCGWDPKANFGLGGYDCILPQE
jgi:hypothetical protein